MKIRFLAMCLILCLLLSGCWGWMDGSYSSVNPHRSTQKQPGSEAIVVADYLQLRQAMSEMVGSGTETVLLNVSRMDEAKVSENMERAIQYILKMHPIGAYAVESVTYELGTSGGQAALAVTVQYNQNKAELRGMKTAAGMSEAETILNNALSQCETKLVMRVNNYRPTDFTQLVRDYMEENPQTVMELPKLTVSTFPEEGTQRVVEIVFTYQTGRDDLKTMQSRVRPLFTSAELYVSGNNTEYEKYALLYAFLMERHDYQFETSMTPSYSLLIHGVGDSQAFSVVYAAMCRRAGLECQVVSGTCNGETQFWNIIRVDGMYHHLDLVNCSRSGAFQIWGDADMSGYVWDYSAYPVCESLPKPEETVDPTDQTELTDSPETTEPTEVTETTEPTEITEPTERTEPTESTEATEPTEPTETTETPPEETEPREQE